MEITQYAPSRNLIRLAKWHQECMKRSLREARRVHQEFVTNQNMRPKLIVRIPVQSQHAKNNLDTLAAAAPDPQNYLSDYGYSGLKPYEKCSRCKRSFQVQKNGRFGLAHNKYCRGVPPSYRKMSQVQASH